MAWMRVGVGWPACLVGAALLASCTAGCSDGNGEVAGVGAAGGSGGSGHAGGPVGGSDQGGSDPGGNGQGGNGQGGEPTPILERPAQLALDCSVLHPPAPIGSSQWTGRSLLHVPSGLVAAAGEDDEVRVSTFDETGQPSTLATLPHLGWPTGLAERENELALVWDHWSPEIFFAKLDTTGTVLSGPHKLADSGSSGVGPRVFPTADGFVVLWWETGQVQGTLEWLQTDADGTPQGAPQTVFAADGGVSTPTFVSRGDGIATAWTQHGPGDDPQVYVAALDASGSPLFGPQRVSRSGWDSQRPSLLRVAGGYVVAWAESLIDWEDQEGTSIIRLARLDEQGQRLGSIERLQAPVTHQDHQQPVLADFDGQLAVAWSQGEMIYYCAGCMPDHDLAFVLVDPEQWVPSSELLHLPGSPGLLETLLARDGSDVLALFNHTYHGYSQPGTAVVRCE